MQELNAKNFLVFSEIISVIWSGIFAFFILSVFSATITDAPLSIAFWIKSWPSELNPEIAINIYPGLIFLELLSIPFISISIFPFALIPSIPIICNRCGFISSHALGILGLLPPKTGDNQKGGENGK